MTTSGRGVAAGLSAFLSPGVRARIDATLLVAARSAGFAPLGGHGWGRDFWQLTLTHRDGFGAGLYAARAPYYLTLPGFPAADAPGRRPAEPASHVWVDAIVPHPDLTHDEWEVADRVLRQLERHRRLEGHYRDEAAPLPHYLLVQYPYRGPLEVEPVTTFLTGFVLELYRLRASIPHAEFQVSTPRNPVGRGDCDGTNGPAGPFRRTHEA